MQLYISNCTKQVQDFIYRVPEDKAGHYRRQIIPIGGQTRIYRDDTFEVLKGIVDQHACYGLVAVENIDTTQEFIGLAYSFGRAIPSEAIEIAIDHNQDVLNERGIEIRKEALGAAHNAMEVQAYSQGNELHGLETEVREQGKPGEGVSERLAEHFVIEKPGREPKRPRNRK
jgi:hypothetical protein